MSKQFTFDDGMREFDALVMLMKTDGLNAGQVLKTVQELHGKAKAMREMYRNAIDTATALGDKLEKLRMAESFDEVQKILGQTKPEEVSA